MQQPELGKKITVLRKQKGLTQNELAQLCNISIRTIQRIETAEVTPRSYTTKLIFNKLDYAFNFSVPDSEYPVSQSVEQENNPGKIVYYLKDLLNLKTQTMKKILILSIPVFFVLSLLVVHAGSGMNKSEEEITQIIHASNEKLVEWVNSGQTDSLKTLFMDKATIMPSNSPEIKGIDNIVRFYEGLHYSGFQLLESKSDKISFSANMVIDKGEWLAKVNDHTLQGYYITQWQKIDGNWYITMDMTNISLPGIQ